MQRALFSHKKINFSGHFSFSFKEYLNKRAAQFTTIGNVIAIV